MSNEEMEETLEPVKDQRTQEEQEISQLLLNLGEVGDWQAKLYRVDPKDVTVNGRKVNVSGLLETFTSNFTEEDIMNIYGGGKYTLKVLKKDKKGQLKWAGGKTFSIAGNPKMPKDRITDFDETPSRSREDSSLSGKALDLMARSAEEERLRADRERDRAETLASRNSNGNGMNNSIQMMELMMKPVYDQIKASQQENAMLRQQLIESQREVTNTLSKKPDTSFQDTILARMVDNKSSEIQSIRTQHESELRMLRESNRDEIKRLEDRRDRDVDSLKSDHKRQLDMVKEAGEHRIRTMELSHQQQLATMESTIKRLEHDVSGYKSEITTLRSEKIKSPIDMISEIAKLKENLELLGGGDSDDEEEKPGWERLVDKIADNPLAKTLMEKLANTGTSMPQLTQQQFEQMQAEQVEKQEVARGFSQNDIETAILFIEQAISKGQNPVEFARAAQNLVPKKLLDQLVATGSDEFVTAIEAQRPDSIIASVSGRKFLKAAFDFLSSRETSPGVEKLS